jgi:phosphoserine phosphatase RsbU/P
MGDISYRLACFELWGGNRKVAHAIELPGLLGWVYSDPFGPDSGGGDVHYFSVCSKGMVSRVALADVAGHGPSVSLVAERLREALRLHTDSWDQSFLMRELSDAFLEVSAGTQFATAAVLGFYLQTNELLFSYAGHPPALWYRAAERSWNLLHGSTPYARKIEDLPLGLIPGTAYTQSAVQLGSNDVLILYTDGITEARDGTGKALGQEGLLDLVRDLPLGSPAKLGQALISGVEAFRGKAPRGDDETIVVLRNEKVR